MYSPIMLWILRSFARVYKSNKICPIEEEDDDDDDDDDIESQKTTK